MIDIHLLVIDPQKDFCDPNGSLFVPGADEDMKRLAGLVQKLGGNAAGDRNKLKDIHVTMDSHRKVDISHPIWWKDSSGNPPPPFTIITATDMKTRKWTTRQPSFEDRTLRYLEALATGGRYPHCIWPEHCLIGSEGHAVAPELFGAFQEWADRFATVDYVTKGSNPWTEHFSAVKAEVPDPQDPTTQVNTTLIQTLEEADIILLAGEARSHCISNSISDVADHFSDPKYVQKMTLLSDCTSDVPGFEHLGEDFVKRLVAKGMSVKTSTDFLAQVL